MEFLNVILSMMKTLWVKEEKLAVKLSSDDKKDTLREEEQEEEAKIV